MLHLKLTAVTAIGRSLTVVARAVRSPATAAVIAASLFVWGTAAWADPFLDRVKTFVPGDFAGFGADALPGIVLGPPQGEGEASGSFDVVSLGDNGSITVVFRDNIVVDEEGDDLVVYENVFRAGEGFLFTEYAFVEVSSDGVEFLRFPHDAATGEGLAGGVPVWSNSLNGIDPLAPEAGGDRFDIGDLGLDYVRYLRLVDAGAAVDDIGNRTYAGGKGGFDLDAAAALHSARPARIRGTVFHEGEVLVGARVRLKGPAPLRRRVRRTRDDGTFRLRRLLPVGDCTLRVRMRGIGRIDVPVFLGLDQRMVRLSVVLGVP